MEREALVEILALPHRPPFRFVTELISLEPGVRGAAAWAVAGTEDFFRGHFPGEAIVPGVLVTESMAQLAGLVAFGGVPGQSRPARLAQVDVKLLSAVRPPARIELAASLTRAMGDLILFDVAARVGTVAAASGSLVLARAANGGGS